MERNIEGYHFSCDEDAKMALDEVKKINLISEKLSSNNPKAVLLVYNKCIQSNMFTTPVGIDYLKRLQNYLRENPSVDNAEILDIPIRISYEDALAIKSNKRFQNIDKKEPKSYRKEFSFSLLLNIVLIVLVISMFVIALGAKNPNIINYENAITNKYSTWEQELTERERVIKEKEREIKKQQLESGVEFTEIKVDGD